MKRYEITERDMKYINDFCVHKKEYENFTLYIILNRSDCNFGFEAQVFVYDTTMSKEMKAWPRWKPVKYEEFLGWVEIEANKHRGDTEDFEKSLYYFLQYEDMDIKKQPMIDICEKFVFDSQKINMPNNKKESAICVISLLDKYFRTVLYEDGTYNGKFEEVFQEKKINYIWTKK